MQVTDVGGGLRRWHARHARELLGRHGGRLWAPSRGRAPVARRAGEVTDPFRPDDPLPGGVVALATARGNEVVYHLPGQRALVAGDVILGAEGGGLRLCPESWLPPGTGTSSCASRCGRCSSSTSSACWSRTASRC